MYIIEFILIISVYIGIGEFNLIDNELVKLNDIGNNFFLTLESLNKVKSSELTKHLVELNDNVKGRHLDLDITSLLQQDTGFFNDYSGVVAHQINNDNIKLLSNICWELNIPLFLIKSTGFYSMLRIQLPEQTIINTHPQSIVDLRLNKPFKKLREFSSSIDLDKVDNYTFSHIPFIVILIKALDYWKQYHNSNPPLNLNQKKEFKNLINSWRRPSVDGLNFDEAISQSYRAFQVTNVPEETSKLFNDISLKNLSSTSNPFWYLVAALSEFVKLYSILPHPGTLQDFHTDTQTYVYLKSLYKDKSRIDSDVFKNLLKQVLSKFNKNIEELFTEDDINTFIKNSSNLKVIKGTKISDELTTPNKEKIINGLSDEFNNESFAIYVTFLAFDNFFIKNGRYAGDDPHSYDDDLTKLKEEVATLLKEKFNIDVVPSHVINVVGEFVRSAGSDLPTSAAFMGGLTSQEVIKVITNQYIPIENTCIVNLIKSTTMVEKM